MKSAWLLLAIGLLVAVAASAYESVDHSKTRFPLLGRHQKVPCESCHPASQGTRVWKGKGVPLDCVGCHSDRRSHKGSLGVQCERCHDVSGWKSVSYPAAKHRFPLVGNHNVPCASCHIKGAHLTAKVTCADCHEQKHRGTRSPCETCHNVDTWKRVSYTKHTYDPELLPGKHRTATCLQCHPKFKFSNSSKSVPCESCHEKDRRHEDLGTCRSCHSPLTWSEVKPNQKAASMQQGGAEPRRPLLTPGSPDTPGPTTSVSPAQPTDLFRVRSKFDHISHARLVKAKGRKANCTPCHGGTGAQFQARPQMRMCESCHDGDQAFDALGTQCSRCHAAPTGTRLSTLPPPPKPFQHAAHRSRQVNIDACTSCHGVGVEPDKVQAGRDQHRPCQECHAAEFRTQGQGICLSCHLRNDPFRPNPLRLPTVADSEWRLPSAPEIPHAKHQESGVPCKNCHTNEAGLKPEPPELGHAVCSRCHVVERVPKKLPQGTPVTLDHCSACHVPSSEPEPRDGARRPWSTHDRFRHDNNHRTPQTCPSCHFQNGAATLTFPTMQSCGSCHDGRTAFALIGPKECALCHGAGPQLN
jgi:hypothetical protein